MSPPIRLADEELFESHRLGWPLNPDEVVIVRKTAENQAARCYIVDKAASGGDFCVTLPFWSGGVLGASPVPSFSPLNVPWLAAGIGRVMDRRKEQSERNGLCTETKLIDSTVLKDLIFFIKNFF